jgi:hypothetical protein
VAKQGTSTTSNKDKYSERRWSIPSKRAKGYAQDRKAKVHTYGKKEGKELTDFEAGIRSGYLQCQGDHAGLYKYKKALAEGKSKAEARDISRRKSK